MFMLDALTNAQSLGPLDLDEGGHERHHDRGRDLQSLGVKGHSLGVIA